LDHFVAKYKGGGPAAGFLTPKKFSVIPNGVPDLSSAKADAPKTRPQEMVIGTCCRIMPSKRIEYFIRMLAELNRVLPGVRMELVGALHPRYEDYWRSLQKLARELGVTNLHFAGQQADVTPFLRRFQVFVMLGTDHGCPNASLEAMSAGLPIVAARHGGTSEQVKPGVNGYLVPDQDPRAMALKVRKLLTDPPLRRRFGRAGRKIAREKFSMDLMVKRYSALLFGKNKRLLKRPIARPGVQGFSK
jgi:glycosyltransferase involved in cell wall biosynthesis